jgi:RNA polymerase sigma-70 factor (ECF subfamily)
MDEVYRLNYQGLTDLELLEHISNQDRDALETLYERYGRRVFSLAVRILSDSVSAEEVTQDVFMSVWRRGATYVSKKGKFTTWLFSIAHNRTIDELRKRRRDRSRTNDDIDDHLNLESSDVSPADATVAQSEYAKIRAAMEKLPDEQKNVVELSYFKGLTQTEIADKTGQPLGTVKTRMRLALKKLRKALSAELGTQV